MGIFIAILTFFLILFLVRLFVNDHGFRRISWLVISVWYFPLFFMLVAPFKTVFDLNSFVVFISISIVFLIIFFPILIFRGRIKNSALYAREVYLNEQRSSIVLLLAACSFLFILVDIFYYRGVTLSLDLHGNRELYDGDSPLSHLVMLFLPFSYIALVYAFRDFSLKSFLYFLPYVACSLVYLVSGNRQYFIFGFIILMCCMFFLSGQSFIRRLAIAITVVSFVVVSMLFVQFSRQSYAEGQQAEFIYSISNISCEGDVCEKAVVVPLVYLYQYFGVEYLGLSAIYDLKVNYGVDALPLSQTLPVLYRRLEGLLNLPPQMEEHLRLHSEFNDVFGVFPRFWKTMYSGVLQEYGPLGFLWLGLFFFLTHIMMIYSFLKRPSSLSFAFLMAFYSSIIFGVMFFPLFEPVIFILSVYGFLYSLANSFFGKLKLGN